MEAWASCWPDSTFQAVGGEGKRLKSTYPLRKIVNVRTYKTSNFPGEAAALKLECGHTVHCKRSQMPKHRARCYWCEPSVAR